jgi:hypothetical protein
MAISWLLSPSSATKITPKLIRNACSMCARAYRRASRAMFDELRELHAEHLPF